MRGFDGQDLWAAGCVGWPSGVLSSSLCCVLCAVLMQNSQSRCAQIRCFMHSCSLQASRPAAFHVGPLLCALPILACPHLPTVHSASTRPCGLLSCSWGVEGGSIKVAMTADGTMGTCSMWVWVWEAGLGGGAGWCCQVGMPCVARLA